MAVAAAEQIKRATHEGESPESPLPLVIAVPEMAEDVLARRQAERLILGATAVSSCVETTPSPPERLGSLMEAIHWARKGYERGLKLVQTNVGTDVIERTIKVGHVMSVPLTVTPDGKFWQHGQTTEQVQENTLRYASDSWQMRERAEAETRNNYRLEHYYQRELLEDHYFVVFSRAADTMSTKELDEAGFFVDTMTCVIQATTANGEAITTESAFVAGCKEPGGERHDQQTIAAVGAALSVDYANKSACETIDTPLLIHKSLMPNGVTDLVKLYDIVAGGTFFGQDKAQSDYLGYLEICKQREKDYLPKIQLIMGELLTCSERITSPRQAVRFLHQISEKHMVEQSVYDTNIDPLVFGQQAAYYIGLARVHSERGNLELAEAATGRALRLAVSSSCPTGVRDQEDLTWQNGSEANQPKDETWHGGKKHYNTKCQSCNEVKTEVGACYICEDCVHNPRKMQRAHQKQKSASSKLTRIGSIGSKDNAEKTS